MTGDAERQPAGQVPGHEHGDEGRGDDEVGGDQTAGAAGQGDDRGYGGQLVAHDDGVGALQGQVGARPGS